MGLPLTSQAMERPGRGRRLRRFRCVELDGGEAGIEAELGGGDLVGEMLL